MSRLRVQKASDYPPGSWMRRQLEAAAAETDRLERRTRDAYPDAYPGGETGENYSADYSGPAPSTPAPKIPQVNEGEELFALQLRSHGIPFEREYRFHPTRKWRADFYIAPDLLVEIEGGVFAQGRHTQGVSFVEDCSKYNAATAMGYRVFRFVPNQHVKSGEAVAVIDEVLRAPL